MSRMGVFSYGEAHGVGPTATQSTSRDYHSLLKHESETESVPLSLLMNTGRHLARMHGRAI